MRTASTHGGLPFVVLLIAATQSSQACPGEETFPRSAATEEAGRAHPDAQSVVMSPDGSANGAPRRAFPSRTEVMNAMRSVEPALKRCQLESLRGVSQTPSTRKEDPGRVMVFTADYAEGALRLLVSVTFLADGTVHRVLLNPAFDTHPVRDCIVAAIRQARVPAFEGGPVTGIFTFVFR